METIDLTPTWAGITPSLILILESSSTSEDSKEAARAELQKMARLADKYNKLASS